MRRWLLALLLLLSTPLSATVESGLWYDRTREGHGLDLHRFGEVFFGTFYTFDQTGKVQWLWIQTSDSPAPQSTLGRYTRGSNGVVSGREVGEIRFTPVTACPDGFAREGARALVRLDFVLDGRAATWCIEPLLPPAPPAMAVTNGAWYAPDDSGWGLMSHAYALPDGSTQAFRILYFHDQAGQPRWAYSYASGPALEQDAVFYTPYVECTDCPTSLILTTRIGSGRIRLSQPLVDADGTRNHIEVNVAIDGEPPFVKSKALGILSTPLRVPAAAATSEGPVAGSMLAEGIERFVNIPYVQPPTGPLRWRAPQALAPSVSVRTAREPGALCPQPEAGLGAQDEDCLQLNVWRPAAPGPHPVMVWIHGGGHTQGSAVQVQDGALFYDGTPFASRGVVFVSINYRLGLLGYLAQRDFVAEAPDFTQAGNYGLLDQIAALRWVQRNIASFGGDPTTVTIFGESAGGVSTCALMAAPAARGLFQRAIVQSGNCLWSPPSLATGLAQGDRVTSATGCASAADKRACLRNLSPGQLMAAVPPVIDPAGMSDGESFGPILDGSALTEAPGRAIANGTAAPVPLLIGVTDDETTTLVPANTLPATAAGYEAAIRARFPAIAEPILQQYPAAAYPSPQRAYQDLLDDALFTCAARRAASDQASRGIPTFHYVLTETLPQPGVAALESFHGLDVVLLFAPAERLVEYPLAERMQRAWVEFASGVTPGSGEVQPWPLYQTASRLSRELNGARSSNLVDYHRDACNFWDRYLFP